MDILGFVFVVAGLIAGHHYGYIGTGLEALRSAYRGSVKFLQRTEYHYTRLAARRIVLALALSAGSQFALLAGTTLLLQTFRVPWYGTFATAGLLLIAAEVIYARYQRSGIPRFLTDEQGAEVRWPEYVQNEHGRLVDEQGNVLHVNDDGFPLRFFQNEAGAWLDPDGNVLATNNAGRPLRYGTNGVGQWVDWTDGSLLTVQDDNVVQNGQPVNLAAVLDTTAVLEQTDLRIPHPLSGLPVLDPDQPNNLERVSTAGSAALIMTAFTVIGVGLMTVGIQAKNSLVFLLGAMCIYAMLIVLQLLANVIGWAIRKVAKLLEFISTVVTEGGLVTLPGITWSNIKQYLPGGVDYLDEEYIAAILRAFPLQLAMHITPFVAVVYMWPDPVVANVALALLVITTITGVYLAKNGGSQEVQNQKYKFARLMFYGLPAILILSTILGLISPDLKQVVTAQLANLKAAAIGYGTGQIGIPIYGAWSNFGTMLLYLLLAPILVLAARMASPKDASAGWLRRTPGWFIGVGAILAVLASGWHLFGLIKNALGQTEVRAPVADIRTPEQKKADELTAKVAELERRLGEQKTTVQMAQPAQTDMRTDKKPPVRYAGKTKSRSAPTRPQGSRGSLDPSFVAEYRAITGEDP